MSRISIYGSDHLLSQGIEVTALSCDNIYSADISKPVALDTSALIKLFDTTVDREDYVIACQMQQSANSGMIAEMKFGRNEPGVQHAHNAIRGAIGLAPLARYREMADG